MLTKQTLFRLFRSSILIAAAALAIYAIAADSLQTSSTEELGEFLVDGEGMSVYLFLPDEQGPSTCTGGCLEAWPPVTVPEGFMAEIELGEGLDQNLIGMTQREGGASQVTYNGWPLYYFAQDAEAGDTAGQAVGGNWYLVSPEGMPIGAESSMDAGAEDSAAGGDMASTMELGANVYSQTCASCHGADGDEANASHTALLVESERVIGDTGMFTRRVLFGGSYMPAFGQQLDDRQAAAVMTYVRNSWGFDFPAVTEEEVRETRERFQ